MHPTTPSMPPQQQQQRQTSFRVPSAGSQATPPALDRQSFSAQFAIPEHFNTVPYPRSVPALPPSTSRDSFYTPALALPLSSNHIVKVGGHVRPYASASGPHQHASQVTQDPRRPSPVRPGSATPSAASPSPTPPSAALRSPVPPSVAAPSPAPPSPAPSSQALPSPSIATPVPLAAPSYVTPVPSPAPSPARVSANADRPQLAQSMPVPTVSGPKAVRIKLKLPAQGPSDPPSMSGQTERAKAVAMLDKPVVADEPTNSEAKVDETLAPPDFSDLSYDRLCQTGRFEQVDYVSVLTTSQQELTRIILEVVEDAGRPVILTDLHKLPAWDAAIFQPETYERSLAQPSELVQVRNLSDLSDRSMTVQELLRHCKAVKSYSATDRDRLYGRDLACPRDWQKTIASLVHPRLTYHGQEDVAASLEAETRVETQMCYFGSGNTFAPLRRELCSSYGQNLMVWSDAGASSIWIITKAADANKVDDFIRSSGGDPDAENFAVHPDALQHLPYPIFCCRQKVGDLVLIPSGATRQVANVDGRTLKVAWSRMSIDTLEEALHVDLPMYQRICRKETYRIKAVVEATLAILTKSLQNAVSTSNSEDIADLSMDLRRVLNMYDQILSDEYVPDWREHKLEGDVDSYVECDFCGADVLLSYFECASEHTLCSLCYCQGRRCPCETLSALRPRQLYLSFDKRLELRNAAASLLESLAGTDSDQPPIDVMNEKEVKKTSWPHSFMAACRLYNLRLSLKPDGKHTACDMCKGPVNKTTGYKCKPCHSWYCFRCLLHQTYIHPVHVLAQSNAVQFHKYHESFSVKDYIEWKENPTVYFVEAQVHFALIEAGITRQSCAPLNPDCNMGFLDTSPDQPLELPETSEGASLKPSDKIIKPSKRPLDVSQSPASSPQPATKSNKRAKLTSSTESAASTPQQPSTSSIAETHMSLEKTPNTPTTTRVAPLTSGGSKSKTRATVNDAQMAPSPSLSKATTKAEAATGAAGKAGSRARNESGSASSNKSTANRIVSTDNEMENSPSSFSSTVTAQNLVSNRLAALVNNGLLPSEESVTPTEAATPKRHPTVPISHVPTSSPAAAGPTRAIVSPSVAPSVSNTLGGAPSKTNQAAATASTPPAAASSRDAIAAASVTLPAANGTTAPLVSSLASLDSKSLKILTEILGIFSKDVNQRTAERHQELKRNLDGSNANHQEILRELREQRSEQQRLLQLVQQVVQNQQEHKAREDARHKETAAQIAELQDAISDLTGDVTRGAQARLELEKKQQSARTPGHHPNTTLDNDPHAYLHRTSKVRTNLSHPSN